VPEVLVPFTGGITFFPFVRPPRKDALTAKAQDQKKKGGSVIKPKAAPQVHLCMQYRGGQGPLQPAAWAMQPVVSMGATMLASRLPTTSCMLVGVCSGCGGWGGLGGPGPGHRGQGGGDQAAQGRKGGQGHGAGQLRPDGPLSFFYQLQKKNSCW
jgi:hypothetical protein